MHRTTEEVLERLRRHGLRVTAARRAIVDALLAGHEGHLSAKDVGDGAARRLGRPVDPSTVYRTLDVLEELGIVHHVHLGHGASIYHLSDAERHHHLVCEVCGRSVDLDPDELDARFADVARRHGFVAGSVHFALMGRCDDCVERSSADGHVRSDGKAIG